MIVTFRYLLLALALALGGCVLPNRLAEEDPFRKDVVGFIEPGITLKTDIERQLGTQYLVSSHGRWWVFPADRRMTEWFWIFCVPGGCDGDTFGGDIHRYYLAVEFDNADLVRRIVVVTDQNPCIDDRSVCFDDDELTIVEDEETLQFALEYDIAETPCAFLLRDTGYEHNGLLGELLASPGADCCPALTMRNGLAYALEATQPYTGGLTVSGVDGTGRLERSYERGKLNGAETAWSESGKKLYEANYRDDLLHGLFTYWQPDGAAILRFCFENGEMTHQSADDCD